MKHPLEVFMSRSLSLTTLMLTVGCAAVDARVVDPSVPGAAADASLSGPPVDRDPSGEGTLPSITVDVGGMCDPALETQPHNSCAGEPMLGLDLVSLRDADGDGRWSRGEVLAVELELFASYAGEDGWVNYPGVFVDLPDGAVQAEPMSGTNEVMWFYGIYPHHPYRVVAHLVAEDTVQPGAQLVFTVGSLHCMDRSWGDPCPVPSPLRVTIGG